jgi:hypothetical protein
MGNRIWWIVWRGGHSGGNGRRKVVRSAALGSVWCEAWWFCGDNLGVKGMELRGVRLPASGRANVRGALRMQAWNHCIFGSIPVVEWLRLWS